MEFSKARIEPEGKPAFNVLFNPTQYMLEHGNDIAEATVPGLDAPLLQFIRGNSGRLGMELFFDTFEEQTDVRDHTGRIYALIPIDPETHVPPIVSITWGSFRFRGVLEQVSGRFTLFLPNGTPVRAVLNVSFREYKSIDDLVRPRPTESADHRKTRVVRRGDSLSSIAWAEYGDARKWRPIADANRLEDPRTLVPGGLLVIPQIE